MTEDRTMTHFEEFENALMQSAESLFATLKQPAISWKPCPRPRPSHEDTVLASLGFGGDHFRGNVIIASSLASAKPLCPPILGDFRPLPFGPDQRRRRSRSPCRPWQIDRARYREA